VRIAHDHQRKGDLQPLTEVTPRPYVAVAFTGHGDVRRLERNAKDQHDEHATMRW
jgi:hypothetical protein